MWQCDVTKTYRGQVILDLWPAHVTHSALFFVTSCVAQISREQKKKTHRPQRLNYLESYIPYFSLEKTRGTRNKKKNSNAMKMDRRAVSVRWRDALSLTASQSELKPTVDGLGALHSGRKEDIKKSSNSEHTCLHFVKNVLSWREDATRNIKYRW